MEHISKEKSLELFLDTLGYLDEKYVNGSDNDINYFILTELDIDTHTFLHSYTVDILVDNKFIPESLAEKVDQLRNFIRYLIDNKNTLEEIRNDNEWKNARQIAKEILNEIADFKKNKD